MSFQEVRVPHFFIPILQFSFPTLFPFTIPKISCFFIGVRNQVPFPVLFVSRQNPLYSTHKTFQNARPFRTVWPFCTVWVYYSRLLFITPYSSSFLFFSPRVFIRYRHNYINKRFEKTVVWISHNIINRYIPFESTIVCDDRYRFINLIPNSFVLFSFDVFISKSSELRKSVNKTVNRVEKEQVEVGELGGGGMIYFTVGEIWLHCMFFCFFFLF